MSLPMLLTGDTDEEYALRDIHDELARARAKFGPMASAHEGQSVVAEEFEEFSWAVWWGVDQRGRPADPHDEAVQLAAMALRFLIDVPRRQP